MILPTCPMCRRERGPHLPPQQACACPMWVRELYTQIAQSTTDSSIDDLTLLAVNHFPSQTAHSRVCACGRPWPCPWITRLAARLQATAVEPPSARALVPQR